MSIEQWQKTNAYQISHKGQNIFYKMSATDTTQAIVLFHGAMGSSWDWHLLFDELSVQYKVIAVDLLGFGLSDKTTDDTKNLSLPQQTEVLEAIFNVNRIKTVHIVGHDLGAGLAMGMLLLAENARRESKMFFPEIKSITFINGEVLPKERQLTAGEQALFGLFKTSISKQWYEKEMIKRCGKTPLTPQAIDLRWQAFSFGDYFNDKEMSKALLKSFAYLKEQKEDYNGDRTSWRKALKTTNIPVLLIYGTSDPVYNEQYIKRYLELTPKSKIEKMNHIGHYPHLESPQETLNLILAFINQI